MNRATAFKPEQAMPVTEVLTIEKYREVAHFHAAVEKALCVNADAVLDIAKLVKTFSQREITRIDSFILDNLKQVLENIDYKKQRFNEVLIFQDLFQHRREIAHDLILITRLQLRTIEKLNQAQLAYCHLKSIYSYHANQHSDDIQQEQQALEVLIQTKDTLQIEDFIKQMLAIPK